VSICKNNAATITNVITVADNYKSLLFGSGKFSQFNTMFVCVSPITRW